MSDLKSLLLRINSVKSTKKITRVMQMIAASKLRSAQKNLATARTFADRLQDTIIRTCNAANPQKGQDIVLIISSDKGLCGGYNSGIVKLFLKSVDYKNKDTKFIFAGQKAHEVLKRLVPAYMTIGCNLNFFQVKDLIDNLQSQLGIKTLSILYTKYKNAMSLVPTLEQIFPIKDIDTQKAELKPEEYGFEPNFKSVAQKLYLEYKYAKTYECFAESVTSENMSRMLTMDGATKNAQNVVDDLTLKYNRSRQEKITKELIEIVSGAESL